MAVKLRATVIQIESYLAQSGYFDTTSIGEPLAAPTGVHGAVFIGPGSMDSLTLTGTIERRSVIVRLYTSAMAEPKQDTEFLLDDISAELIEDFCGDFDLGSNGIRNIDIINIRTQPGYQTIGAGGNNAIYRVLDITLPLIVDDSGTFVA